MDKKKSFLLTQITIVSPFWCHNHIISEEKICPCIQIKYQMLEARKVLTLCYTVKFVSGLWLHVPVYIMCVSWCFKIPSKTMYWRMEIYLRREISEICSQLCMKVTFMYMYLWEYLYYTLKNFAHNILGLFTFKPLQETYCTNLWNTTPSHIHKAKKISPTSLQPCQSARCLGALFFHQCRTVMFMVGGRFQVDKKDLSQSHSLLTHHRNYSPESMSNLKACHTETLLILNALYM